MRVMSDVQSKPSLEILRRFLVIVAFSFWVGGFFFYAGVVVPTGSAVLGSHTTQGFVTQRVTHWMNVASGPTLLIFFWNLLSTPRSLGSWVVRLLFWTWLLMLGVQIVLLLLHPVLDRMLVPAEERIINHPRFYRLHGLYLDLASVQHFAAILHLWCAMNLWRRADRTAGTGFAR
jgi:hypothetical protein